MVLPASGTITLTDLANEFGGTGDLNLSDYYSVDLGVPTHDGNSFPPPPISFSDFYGTTGVGPTVAILFSSTSSATVSSYTFTPANLTAPAISQIIVTVSINALENAPISINGVTTGGNAMTLVTKNKGTAIFQLARLGVNLANFVVSISGGNATKCAINVYYISSMSGKNTNKSKIYSISGQITSAPLVSSSLSDYKNWVAIGVSYIPLNATTFTRISSKWVQAQNSIINSSTRHLSHYILAEMLFLPSGYLHTTDGGTLSYSLAVWR